MKQFVVKADRYVGASEGRTPSQQVDVCTFEMAFTPLSCVTVQAAALSADTAPKKGSIQKWENGFQLERLAMGKPDGKLAKPGKKVTVSYKGTFASNGKVFDETKGNKSFSFRLGMLQSSLICCVGTAEYRAAAAAW